MISKTGGSTDDIVSVLRVEDPVVKNEMINLTDSRNQNLNNNITTNFVQGLDSRNPAEEGENYKNIANELPPPPPPPTGQ